MTQAELCEVFSISDQTVRNWVARGLPVRKGPLGKPRYPCRDAFAWGLCWQKFEHEGKAPRWLTPEAAMFWYLLGQHADAQRETGAQRRGPVYVIVPLAWDHPAREDMLSLAARGVRPTLEADENSGDEASPAQAYGVVALSSGRS